MNLKISKKSIIYVFLIIYFMVSFSSDNSSFAKKQQATVQLRAGLNLINVNGIPAPIDMAPEIKYGKMFISIRTLTNEVWMVTLDWDPVARKVTINSRYSTIIFWIGKNIAYVDGEPKQIDPNPLIVPYIKNSRSMLPIRFIADNLYAKSLTYDAKTSSATVVLEWFPNDLFCDWHTKGGNTQKQYWVPSAFELKNDNIVLSKISDTEKLGSGALGFTSLLVACDGLAYFSNNIEIYMFDPITAKISILKQIEREFGLVDMNLYNDRLICSSQKGLLCLDRFTGRTIWKNFDNNSVMYGIKYYGSELAQDKIIQVSQFEIHCTNALDGKLIWEFRDPNYCNECENYSFHGDFIIDEKLLWVSFNKKESYNIICLNIYEGKNIWKKQFKNPILAKMFIDSKVIVTEANQGLYALDAWTGNEIWHNNQIITYLLEDNGPQINLYFNLYNYMAVYDKKLFCQDKEKLYCLDNTSGKILWGTYKNHECGQKPAINTFSFLADSKRLYAFEKDSSDQELYIGYCPVINSDKLRIFDISDGSLIKETYLTENEYVGFMNLVIHKRKLYLLTINNETPVIKVFE